jgi:hypothetical protein
LDVGLVELSKDEYASTIAMPTNKDIFGNWTKCHMHGNFHPMNKWMHFDKYAMHLPKEIFHSLGQPKFLALWTCGLTMISYH